MNDRLRRLAEPLAHSRRPVLAVVLEGFFNRLGFGIVTFALPLYALELGLSLTEIGIVVAAKALVQPLVKPLMGVAIDRFGSRRSYLLAVTLRFASALLLLVVATPGGLLAVRLVQGAASAAQEPASITVLARGQRRRLARRFSMALGARDLGTVSAGLAAGLLLAATGSFLVLWLLVAALAAVPVALVWAWVREEPPEASGATTTEELEPEPERSERVRLLRDPRLRLIATLGLLGGATAHMTHALFQVYAAQVAGLSAAQIGLIYSLSIAVLLAVGPAAGWVADRLGSHVLANARGLANAASSVVYLVWPAFGGMLSGRLIDDAGKAAFRPTWGSLVATASSQAGARRGRVAANLDAALSLGEALGPLLAAVLWDVAGFTAFLLVRAGLGIAVEVVVARRLRSAPEATLQRAAAPPDLLPGPGRLELEAVHVGADPPVSGAVAPRQVAVVAGPPAELIRHALTRATPPPRGRVRIDGQDLGACSPPSVRRAVAELTVHPPALDITVAEALSRRWPAAPPQELARVWWLCGLDQTAGSLGERLPRLVAELQPLDRGRLALAASLVGDPPVLLLDAAGVLLAPPLAATVSRILASHLGAVVVLNPHDGLLPHADVVLGQPGGVSGRWSR